MIDFGLSKGQLELAGLASTPDNFQFYFNGTP